MPTLPPFIKERFFKTLKGEISIYDFEQWLYADKEVEKHLSPNDYLDLISLNFKKSGAKYDLYNLLKKHIDLGEFETYKMLGLLKEAQQKTGRLPYILMEFYDLYCRGYSFLQDLGLGIGLQLESPSRYGNAETWEDLSKTQQEEVLRSFSPKLEEIIENAVHWLESGQIVLTGEQDELGHYGYNDLRTAEEKKSKLWEPVSQYRRTGFKAEKNLLFDKHPGKKWWEFWK